MTLLSQTAPMALLSDRPYGPPLRLLPVAPLIDCSPSAQTAPHVCFVPQRAHMVFSLQSAPYGLLSPSGALYATLLHKLTSIPASRADCFP